MKEKWIVLAAVVLILFAVGSGMWRGTCPLWTSTKEVVPPSEVVLGALLPLSGDTSAYGANAQNAIELAVSQANAAGGIGGQRIRVVYGDTQADPDVGTAAFDELVENTSLSAVIGPMSSPVAMAVAPLCEEQHVVVISPSASNPDLTSAGDYIFRDCLSDREEGVALADLAFDTLGYKAAALFYIDNAYGQGLADVFADRFEASDGTLVARETFEQDATSYDESLANIAAADPDVIVLIGYAQTGQILVDARAAGLNQQVLSSVMFDNPEILATAGDAAEGVLFTTWAPPPDTPNPERSAFSAAYQDAYSAAPGIFAAEAYDAARLLIAAIEANGDTADGIRDALYSVQGYPGASGTISFDSNGDCIKPVHVKKVEGGRFVYTTY
jgi:branched-chain amino acid transport system substrate-binding protein